jgi:hypothetical protein
MQFSTKWAFNDFKINTQEAESCTEIIYQSVPRISKRKSGSTKSILQQPGLAGGEAILELRWQKEWIQQAKGNWNEHCHGQC